MPSSPELRMAVPLTGVEPVGVKCMARGWRGAETSTRKQADPGDARQVALQSAPADADVPVDARRHRVVFRPPVR